MDLNFTFWRRMGVGKDWGKASSKNKFYIVGQVIFVEPVISALCLSCFNLLRLTLLGSLFIHLSLRLSFFSGGLTWAFGMVLSASCPLSAFCPSSPPSSGLKIRRSSSGLYTGGVVLCVRTLRRLGVGLGGDNLKHPALLP